MRLLMITAASQLATEILPALGVLSHEVISAESIVGPPPSSDVDLVLLDARFNLAHARRVSKEFASEQTPPPTIVVMREGGLVALSGEWAVDDVLLDTAGPAEVDARLRLATARGKSRVGQHTGILTAGELVIDDITYTSRLSSDTLNLTYREFELLKFLAQHPGRVISRARLIHEVWGHDYFGSTKTVDVHVRRIRAKLGPQHEGVIGTVRNVGYKFIAPVQQNHGDDTGDPVAAS
jgi:DNA-binding response OmpR family regulator